MFLVCNSVPHLSISPPDFDGFLDTTDTTVDVGVGSDAAIMCNIGSVGPPISSDPGGSRIKWYRVNGDTEGEIINDPIQPTSPIGVSNGRCLVFVVLTSDDVAASYRCAVVNPLLGEMRNEDAVIALNDLGE